MGDASRPSGASTRRRFQAILFDLGSTLIYFDGEWELIRPQRDTVLIGHLHAAGFYPPEQAFLEQFNNLMRSYYIERDTEFIETTTAFLLRSLLTEWGFTNIPEAVIRSTLASMYAISQAYWKPEDDAHPVLQALKAQGYPLGLISNAGDDTDVQTLVDNANLRGYFDVILSSAAMGIRKPNPRIFLAALEHWGVQPPLAAMVGDSLGADILGARNAGLYSIWIKRRAETAANRAHEDTIQPDAVISTLSELLGLLK
jgi:HAD superfamily hydrolase (TIGR01549 family)